MRATTGQDGRFRIDGIVPGLTQKLQAIEFKIGTDGFLLEDWTPKPGEVKETQACPPETRWVKGWPSGNEKFAVAPWSPGLGPVLLRGLLLEFRL